MSEMEQIIDKSVKLSAGQEDNLSPDYVKKVESAYIRQDKLLAKGLKDRHDKMLSELSASFASKDEAAFSATMEKLSKMGEVLGEGTDEDASNYLASFAVDESDDVGEKKAELSSLSEQVKNIETMLSSVLSGNKVIKLGEPAPAVDDEQVEKKLFNDLDKIVETLKKSHEKYGG